LLSLSSWTALLPYNWSITDYSYPLVIGCESVSKLSAMLVSAHPDVVAADDNVAALGGILLNFPCLSWLGSKYVIDTCSLYYRVYRLG